MQHRHIGAYGLLEDQGNVLLVRKTRGPYRDRLDLPGGGIEFGEDPLAALHREFLEETGLVLAGETLVAALSSRVSYRNHEGEMEDLHHLGLLYRVVAAEGGTLRTGSDGEDSAGAIWMARDRLSELEVTPFAREALDLSPLPTPD